MRSSTHEKAPKCLCSASRELHDSRKVIALDYKSFILIRIQCKVKEISVNPKTYRTWYFVPNFIYFG